MLKSRFETAAKLFGWSFGLVALVFTLFGIKTAIDLRDAAKTTAVEEVRKKLSLDDPNSEIRRDVDRAIARGLVSSYYLSMARHQGYGLAQDVELSETDSRRLVDLILDPRCADKDFLDAADVLLRSDKNARRNHIARIFIGLANAQEDQYKWIRTQPYKRAVIFDLARGGAIATAAMEALVDAKAEQSVKLAAIRYLSRVGLREAVSDIERLASASSEDVARTALEALARLAPESKEVSTALIIRPDAKLEAIVNAVRLAAILVESSWGIAEDPQQSLRNKLSEAPIAEAMKRGLVFGLSTNSTNRKPGLVLSHRDSSSTRYGIPATLLQYDGLKMLSSMLKSSADNEQLLKKLIRGLCLEYEGRCNGIIQVTFTGAGKAKLLRGSMIDSTEAPNGGYLKANSPASNSDISLNWIDKSGLRVTAPIERLMGGAEITLDIRLLRDVVDDSVEMPR